MSYYENMDIIRIQKPKIGNQIPVVPPRESSGTNNVPKDPNYCQFAEKTKYSHRKSKVKKYLLIFLILLASIFFAWGGYFGWKLYSVSKKISISKNSTTLGNDLKAIVSTIIPTAHTPLKGEEDGRINILLLGIAGKNKPGQNLTDTIMVMSINTQSKKIGLLSLPRDLYINIPQTNLSSKINSVYQLSLNQRKGVDLTKNAVEHIFNIPIHYSVILNFDGFKKLIDDLGGVNVYVERDIYDSRYPGPNYSYETFKIEKGSHQMNGETALKYVRERHDDPEGDFGRAKRQQKVIQASKSKIFSLETFLNPLALNSLLNNLGDNIKTDIGLQEIESLLYWSKQVDTQNIENVVVDAWEKDSLLKVSHIFFGNTRAFVLVPRVGNFTEIQELAQNIFNLEKIQRRKEEIGKESASISIVNESGDNTLPAKIKNLLQNKLDFKNVSIIYGQNKKVSDQTLVFDQTSGTKIFSLDELLKKLPAELSQNESDIIGVGSKSDFVVIIGKDLIKTYHFEEDSLEDFKNAQDNQDEFKTIEN